MDDKLLFQNDAGKILSNQELKEALEERGLYVHFILIIILRSSILTIFSLTNGLAQKELQARLSWWLESVRVGSEVASDDEITRRLALISSSR